MSNFYETLEAHWLPAMKRLSKKLGATDIHNARELAAGFARLAKTWQKRGQISQLHLVKQGERHAIAFYWSGALLVLDNTGLYAQKEWETNGAGKPQYETVEDLAFTETSLRYAFLLEDILNSQDWKAPIDYVISTAPAILPQHFDTLANTRSRSEAMLILAKRSRKTPELYLHCIVNGNVISTWRYQTNKTQTKTVIDRQVA